MSSALSPERRYTYGDYRQWIGDERWELIDGDPYLMSPAPNRLHQEFVGGIFAQVRTQLAGHPCRAYVAPFDIRLPQGDEPDDAVENVVQPDIVVVCDPGKLDAAGCRGAPDWVVEVLSPSTEMRDRKLKRDLYQRHGVRELWLVDAVKRRVTIHRLNPQSRLFDSPAIVEMTGRTPVHAVPGLTIDWVLVV